MKKLSLLLLLAALVLPAASFAQKSKKKHKKDEETSQAAVREDYGIGASVVFNNHFTGFALYDPDRGEMLCELNSDKYFTPASNTKIFTLYTALRTLGDSIPALQYSLKGDLLVFWGTGDPSFLNPHLTQNPAVFNFLKNRRGPLLYCPANWQDRRYGSGWMWSDYAYDYQAEKSPFPVYGNVAHFRKDSSGITVTPDFLDHQLELNEKLDREDLVGRAEYDNQFSYNSVVSKGKFFEYHVPFRYSPALLTDLLTDTLDRPVSVLDAAILPPPDARILYSLRSDSLYTLMMHESDNFIAEQLILLCSWMKFGTLNTERMIDFAEKNYLSDLPDDLKWEDGSGLSRYNLFTPRSVVKVLDKIRQQVPQERLFGIFPAGGVSGTIKDNYRNGDKPYIFAKTGTLRHQHSLSGFLLTKKGKVLIFSFMHGNYTGSMNALKREMEKVLERVRDEN